MKWHKLSGMRSVTCLSSYKAMPFYKSYLEYFKLFISNTTIDFTYVNKLDEPRNAPAYELLYGVFKNIWVKLVKGFRADLNTVPQVLAPDKAAYVNLSKENSKRKESYLSIPLWWCIQCKTLLSGTNKIIKPLYPNKPKSKYIII